jgi:hypothetical protein
VLLAAQVRGLLFTVHVRFVEPPTPTVVGLAVSVATTGATVAVPEFIDIVVDEVTVLPATFRHVIVYVVATVSAPLDLLPLVVLTPARPLLPVQLDALLDVQLIVVLPFGATAVAPAVTLAVGRATVVSVALFVTLPLWFEHVSENV